MVLSQFNPKISASFSSCYYVSMRGNWCLFDLITSTNRNAGLCSKVYEQCPLKLYHLTKQFGTGFNDFNLHRRSQGPTQTNHSHLVFSWSMLVWWFSHPFYLAWIKFEQDSADVTNKIDSGLHSDIQGLISVEVHMITASTTLSRLTQLWVNLLFI